MIHKNDYFKPFYLFTLGFIIIITLVISQLSRQIVHAQTATPTPIGSPQVAWTSGMGNTVNLTGSNFTCRWITRPSIAGNSVRIHLSNVYGTASETFNAVTVAYRSTRAAVSSITSVTFGGKKSVAIPAGGIVTSDVVTFHVNAQQEVAVSIYYAGTNPLVTQNRSTRVSSYCTAVSGLAGDHTNDPADTAFTTSTSAIYWLTAVDVYNKSATGAIIALGDSITDGVASTTNAYNSWSDILSNRLLNYPSPKSVANEGISSDPACSNAGGLVSVLAPNSGGVDRLNRDALAQAGVSYIILFLGTNDIHYGSTGDSVIACYQTIIGKVHTAGLKIIGATMLPRNFASTQEAYRTQINTWIRTPEHFDGVIDFDVVVRDPINPVIMLAAYDSGDHTHPNAEGHAAMGNAINLALFGVNTATPTFVPPTIINDTGTTITYAGATWNHSTSRGLGDYQDDVHYSTTDGAYFQYTFTGSHIDYIAEKNSDEGDIDIYIDNVLQQTVSAYNTTRLVQQVIYSKTGLSSGSHTIKGVKKSAKYILVDALKVYP